MPWMSTKLTKKEFELLEDSSEYKEWLKLRKKVSEAEHELLDVQRELDEFELDWSREVAV